MRNRRSCWSWVRFLDALLDLELSAAFSLGSLFLLIFGTDTQERSIRRRRIVCGMAWHGMA